MDEKRWMLGVRIALVLLALVLVVQRDAPPPQDWRAQLDYLSASKTFDFFSWELRALGQKLVYGLLAPHRFMDDAAQARFVLAYLDDVREAGRLAGEIDRFYTDPEVDDPDQASWETRQTLSELRAKMARHAPIAEAILESQVSAVLVDGGLGYLAAILPPVSGAFTPLPHILVISPRDRIESVYQQQLVAGLTAAEQVALEARITETLDDYSAYVTNIGGLAAYPAMLLESSSIDWVTDVMTHEWTHHFLTFRPLGWYYMEHGETRTINETTASLVGDWAGQEIMLRFYDPLFVSQKALPNPLVVETTEDGQPVAPGFDFRAEMHHTRVTVDRLLAAGKITEAEWYMEAQRRYFVAQGYRLRRLNQAYFAFHGAYASTPGASGSDPVGPLVRELWALSETPGDFLRDVAPVVFLSDLRAKLPPAG
jgi:hypothetical protein